MKYHRQTNLVVFTMAFFLAASCLADNVTMRFTYPLTGLPDTNYIKLQKVDSTVLANGSVVGIGIPSRYNLDTNGSVTISNLTAAHYSVTNSFTRAGLVFRVYESGNTTSYNVTNLAVSGFNTFVTIAPTFYSITNALGYMPGTNGANTQTNILLANVLDAGTAGYSNATAFALASQVVTTNGFFTGPSVTNAANALAAVHATAATNGQTSIVFSNPAAFLPSSLNVITQNYSAPVSLTNSANVLAGNGSGLTGVNADSAVTAGSATSAGELRDSQGQSALDFLGASDELVSLRNLSGNSTGTFFNRTNGNITATSFTGDGSGLTNLTGVGGNFQAGSATLTNLSLGNGTVVTNLNGTNVTLQAYATNATLRFARANGSAGSPSVVLTEQNLGQISWEGYTATGSNWPSARIWNKAVSVPTDDHITSQLRFSVGSIQTPSFLTNIFTLAGGDPSPFANLAAPLIFTTAPDGGSTFTVQESGWPDPNNGIEGSTAGGGIKFFQGGVERLNVGSGGITVNKSSSGTVATFNASSGTSILGNDGSGHGFIGTSGNSDFYFLANNTERWRVLSTGHFLAGADNTYDIGAAGATRPRTIYAGTSVVAPNHIGGAGGLTNFSFATNIIVPWSFGPTFTTNLPTVIIPNPAPDFYFIGGVLAVTNWVANINNELSQQIDYTNRLGTPVIGVQFGSTFTVAANNDVSGFESIVIFSGSATNITLTLSPNLVTGDLDAAGEWLVNIRRGNP